MIGRACRAETAFRELVRGPGTAKIRFGAVTVRCPKQKISRREIGVDFNRSGIDNGSYRQRLFVIPGRRMERESRLHALAKSSSHARCDASLIRDFFQRS
jgi:hypothetical protein